MVYKQPLENKYVSKTIFKKALAFVLAILFLKIFSRDRIMGN